MFVAGEGSTRIDLRSVWLLLLYASDFLDQVTGETREALLAGVHDDEMLDAAAEILAQDMRDRLQRMLARGYRRRYEPLTRVRGRIDHLGTARGRLMEAGRVLCSYEDHTCDLPRYRHVLTTLQQVLGSGAATKTKALCHDVAVALERAGVTPVDATRAELAREQFGLHDVSDRSLLALSRLVRDMAIPEHVDGDVILPAIVENHTAMRDLFERAVRNFYAKHLPGFRPAALTKDWPAQGPRDHVAFLPRLRADVVMTNEDQRLIVECKFAPVFETHRDKTMVKPGFVRQVHAYCTVWGAGAPRGATTGVLLGALVRGSTGRDLDITLDGYPFRVRQIDLTMSPSHIRRALLTAAATEPC